MANTNTNTTADTGTGTDTDTDPYAYLFAPIEGRYPVTDPVVWACHISRWTDTKWLAGVLADLCPGHTFTLDPAPYQGEYTGGCTTHIVPELTPQRNYSSTRRRPRTAAWRS